MRVRHSSKSQQDEVFMWVVQASTKRGQNVTLRVSATDKTAAKKKVESSAQYSKALSVVKESNEPLLNGVPC